MITLVSRSAGATERLGEILGTALSGGETLLLMGELGAGKTCFVRGLARGLAIDPRRVKSPSYNILCCHSGGRLVLDHFDAYFVREPEEFERTGMSEFLVDGHVVAVEWADRFPDAFPQDALEIRLEHAEDEARRVTMACADRDGAALLERVVERFESRSDTGNDRTERPHGRRN